MPINPAVIVLCTCPSDEVAKNLARRCLEAHLVACANLIPNVESIYWWEGSIHCDSEVQLLLKLPAAHYPEVEALIQANHPYDEPEILQLPISGGSASYLQWLQASCSQPS